ncbi:hypothetical protein D3C87_1513110 [compost metagenome]
MVEIVQRDGEHAAQKQNLFAQQIAVHRQCAVLHARVHERIFQFYGLVGVAQQDAAAVQRLTILLPLKNGFDDFGSARARSARVRRFADLRAYGKIGIHGFALEGFHGVRQVGAMAVCHRQRKPGAIRKAGGDAMFQE